MSRKKEYILSITSFLHSKFPDADIEVKDESVYHEGHIGYRPGFVSHISVFLVSDVFCGKTRLERHRLVNSKLSSYFSSGLHAAKISVRTFGEVANEEVS